MDSLEGFWRNYPQLRNELFDPLREGYQKFSDTTTTKEEIKTTVLEHSNILSKRDEYESCVKKWWLQPIFLESWKVSHF